MKQIEPGMPSLDRLEERLDRIKGWIEVKGKHYPSNDPYILNDIDYLLTAGAIGPSDIRWGGGQVDHLEFIIYDGKPLVYSEELISIGDEIEIKRSYFSGLKSEFEYAIKHGNIPQPAEEVYKDKRAFGSAIKEFAKTLPSDGGGPGFEVAAGGSRERTEEETALTLAASQGPSDKSGETRPDGPGVESLDDIMVKRAGVEGSIIVKGKGYPSNNYVIQEINCLLETGDLILADITWDDGEQLEIRKSEWLEPEYKAGKKHIRATGEFGHLYIYSDSLDAIDREVCAKLRQLEGGKGR